MAKRVKGEAKAHQRRAGKRKGRAGFRSLRSRYPGGGECIGAKRRRISAVPEKGKGGRDSARCARAIPVEESVLERSEGASAPCRKKEEEGGIPLATLALSRWGGGDLSEAKAHQRRAGKRKERAGFRSLRSRYPGEGECQSRMQPDDFVISGCFISCPYVSKLPTGIKQNSPARCARLHPCFAERAGFEPANPFGRSRAFQTRLFSHSSTSPCGLRVQI